MAVLLAKTCKLLLSQVFLEVSDVFPKTVYRLTWKLQQGLVKPVKFPKPLKVHTQQETNQLDLCSEELVALQSTRILEGKGQD